MDVVNIGDRWSIVKKHNLVNISKEVRATAGAGRIFKAGLAVDPAKADSTTVAKESRGGGCIADTGSIDIAIKGAIGARGPGVIGVVKNPSHKRGCVNIDGRTD